MRQLRALAVLGAVTTIAALGIGAASAQSALAASPWWHVDVGSRPTNLAPGQARDEVQRLVVSPTLSESYLLTDTGTGLYERNGQFEIVELEPHETPENVKAALETLYGANNVEVTSTAPFDTYEIKFVGELADTPVGPLEPTAGEHNGLGPTEVTELTKGRPDGEIVVDAVNLGDESAGCVQVPAGTGKFTSANCVSEGPGEFEKVNVTLSDVLPPYLHAVAIEGSVNEGLSRANKDSAPLECSLGSLSCTFTGRLGSQRFEGQYPKFVPPYDQVQLIVGVNFNGPATAEANSAKVVGGGGPSASSSAPLKISGTPAPFGVRSYEIRPETSTGGLETQAGAHPFQLTTTFDLNEVFERRPVGAAKDLHFKLPPGLIGNPTAVPRCTLNQFLAGVKPQCPAQSVVGVARSTVDLPHAGVQNRIPFAAALFNLEPAAGEPARFGFIVEQVPVLLNTKVRSGGDYGVTVSVTNITQEVAFLSSEVTFWGVPGDRAHDNVRGEDCLEALLFVSLGFEGPGSPKCHFLEAAEAPPLLSLPTSCTGAPLETSVEADSWEAPHSVVSSLNTAPMVALDGCNRLPFEPSIKVTPDSQEGSSPTGLTVDVHVNQDSINNGAGVAESNVRNINVALPEGVAINPAGGDGLSACSQPLVGFEGFRELSSEPGVKNAIFTPDLPGGTAALAAGRSEPLQQGVNFCANASKIGEATIKTPLLPAGQFLKGFVYLATQNENPFGSLVAIYIVAEDPVSGTVVKLPGMVHLTASGQIVTTFEDNPQLAFEDAELHFFGGERAPLASPSRCGAYTTSASFAPWSGGETAKASSTFNVTSGPHGAPCPGANLPFTPTLTGGTPNINAGAFTPLTTTLGRADGQQDLQSVVLHMPAGLEGLLTGVKLCPEAQANDGSCGPESLIGETTVSAGVGNDPVSVTGGKVYLTEKYSGAPFGLSIVNPVKAGPFDLEHDTSNPAQQPACDCVIVRAKIDVDPHTAALTVTTDPSGPHAIPHLIDGVPVQIKKVNVLVNREHFTFNPTNCSSQAITGAIAGYEGGSSPLSVPFQATNCAVLKFTPKVAVATAGHASRANGQSLHFKIAYPKGAMGSQAWFNEAKFTIPKQLPARLTTIQQACLSQTFDANPATCPAAAKIGTAVVHTQVLPVALEGPVYFVSHGGAKFPDAVLDLHGYGIHVQLVGETLIKNGVTSATFRNTPDVPFESIEVTLPTGKYSEFGSNLPHESFSFCGQHLALPTHLKASNGLEVNQQTPIAISGCRTLTNRQKLAAALKACHKKHGAKRAACERTAHKRYGAKKASKKHG